MNKALHLYIGNQEVEFSTPPEILYTYQQTELNNPTVVKNSFSKTITIDGTPSNNQLFGHFWSVERLQNTSAEGNGVYFNASRKVPFTLYLDSVIYEQGYVKLENVNVTGNHITYSITLYGGLGDFFYCLKTAEDGNEKKLSDLDFGVDLGFTANIDTVKEAWDNLGGDNEKWNTINFMTAYNGLPEDFDANRVIINTSNTSLIKSKQDGGKTYKTKDGFVLGELPDEMTEWEIRDLRSYLQRPVIRMKKIVEACCKQENNGGYEVILDEDFFNENNPYWEKTWLTLPMVQNLEYSNEEQVLEGARLLNGEFDEESNTNSYMYQDLYFSIGNFSQQTPSKMTLEGKMKFTGISHPYTSFVWYWNKSGDSYHSGHACYGSLFIQLVAFNGDTVVGASEAYNITSPNRHDGELRYGDNSRYEEAHKFKPYMNQPIYTKLGWNKNGTWCYENTSTPIIFDFTISNCNSNITSLKLCYFWGSSKDKRKKDGINGFYEEPWDSGWVTYSRSWQEVTMSSLNFEITDSSVKAVMGDSLGRTGTKITKELLLNTESTPCDYLLSYCKMFGLYFRKDIENNKIYIETRKTFYNRNEVLDLSNLIDKSKEINITPLSFDTKWYEFKQESDETAFYEKYFSTRGIDYGSKVLNTGYEFIADKKNIMDDNVIKSGIEGLERSKYFTTYNNDNNMRTWFGMGLKYNLYNNNDTIEITAQTSTTGTINGINEGEGMKYYDLIPKLQFHDGDNSGTDGNNVLVFFSGFKDVTSERATPLSYYLTDDMLYQTALNEGTPCWLFTTSETINMNNESFRIAYKLNKIPVFERYLTDNNSDKVIKSLDFGSPQELYVPNYSLTDDTNIYYNFWKTYLEDLYDINTRILTCYVKVEGKPNPDWLRRFYWFDNAIWRLNKISDWNISSLDTTKMEFVKVHNLKDYTSITQEKHSSINLITPIYLIPSDGIRLNLTVILSGGKKWRIINPQSGNINELDNFVILNKTSGEGNDDVVVTISANNTNTSRPIYLTAINEQGQTSKITLYQEMEGGTYFDVQPDNIIVSADATEREVFFNWFNQGNNWVNEYRVEGDIELGCDVDGYEYDNMATITISPNAETTTKSGTITFIGGDYEDTIGIDQLPNLLTFDKDGKEEYTLIFNYNTPNFTDLPYWVSATKVNEKEYKIKAKPNLYKEEQNGVFKVNGVEVKVKQGAGSGAVTTPLATVSPLNFYFNLQGGTKFLMVNIPYEWSIQKSLNDDWIILSQTSGIGNSIVSITTELNEGVKRSGGLQVTNIGDGTTYQIAITQEGSISNPTFTLNPSSTTISKDGGVVRATFIYTDRGDDVISINGNGTSVGQIVWNGEDGYVDITVPSNTTVNEKTYEVIFTNQLGNFIFTIVQDAGDSYISFTNKTSVIGYEGGVITNTINSNTDWIISIPNGVDWINIEPMNGNGDVIITIDVNAYNGLSDRLVNITATTVDGKTSVMTITQSKFVPILNVYPSSITFNADGGTATIQITSNTNWTIDDGTN